MAQLYALFDPRTRVIAAVYVEHRLRDDRALPGATNQTLDALKRPGRVIGRTGQDVDSIPFRGGRETVES